ncbi:sorting nexin-19-like [Daphnia carinata]|uniref:sorting nexin-19-like n=1 Tax=Daphnia carinata TaxID=120202 RepID=UPI00257AE458|nr:sorting nexin-19-like [Daphnia carinata]
MKDMYALPKWIVRFNTFPVFLQVGIIAFSCVFLFFTVDAWFSPFYFGGYQLISYMFVVLILSSWLAHQAISRLVKSPNIWACSKPCTKNFAFHSCRDLSIKDICDYELSSLAKNAAESVITCLCDISGNNEEFVKEIHSQIEDIFFSLSEKLSKIKVEHFAKNLIMIVHNHLRSYKKTMNCSNSLSGYHSKFSFNHPVSRGEISLEKYLGSLSHVVMKEFIPGSIQDCSAVFDLSCAAFCSQVLVKFIEQLSQPVLVLQAIIQILESVDNSTREDFIQENSFGIAEDTLRNTPDIQESSVGIQDPLSGSSPKMQEKEQQKELIENAETTFPTPRKSSPVLSGSYLLCNSLALSSQPTTNSSSWIKSGLSNSISTATAPLLSSQCSKLNVDGEKEPVKMCKPNSLPLIGIAGDNTSGLDPEPIGTFSVDADVSPVYEDVEDFATAIAKLRSLLEQRVSTNGADVPSGKSNIFSPTNDASSGTETDSNFEELTEAYELPKDSQIFFNVKIPKTEVCTLPGEGQHSFYCIVYDGIYTAVSASLSGNGDEKNARVVLKCRTVRRRFRQFMQLHAQLEASEDPSVSKAIRSIRGPSKWLNLPFSRLDQNTVAHRQIFLERFMQQLCTSPAIGMSRELRNFLDYELHLNEINVTPSSATLQRVPFFAKTVSDVLQSIKTALPLPIPLFDNDQNRRMQLLPLPLPTSPPTAPLEPLDRENKSCHSVSSVDEIDGRTVLVPCRVTYASDESKLEMLLNNWNHMDCRIESAYEAFESHLWRSELSIHVSHDSAVPDATTAPQVKAMNTTCETIKDGWDRFDVQLPLSSSLINLLIECLDLRETWLTKAPVPLALKIVVGKQVENCIEESLLQFSNPKLLADSLRSLRHKLDVNDLDVTLTEDKDVNELVKEVVLLLSKQIPRLFIKIVGEDLCTDVLKTTISCLADPLLNCDLALTLLDFIFLQICSPPSSVDRLIQDCVRDPQRY